MCRKGKNNLFTWKWAFHSADSWKLFGFARLDYSLTIMSGMSSWGRNWLTEDSLCFCLHIPKKKKKIFNTISWTTQDFSKIASCSVFLPEIENDVIHIWLASGLLINVKISQAEVKKHTRTHTHTHTHAHTHICRAVWFNLLQGFLCTCAVFTSCWRRGRDRKPSRAATPDIMNGE